jgi:predicted dehydrogenase
MSEESPRKLRYAMVGGGRDAFIGAVHRHAIALDGMAEFTAGALSSTPERALMSGRALGLADSRNHGDWRALLDDELRRPADERVDFVSIVTPTDTHFPIAQAFVAAGFHVVCDKPLVQSGAQAQALVEDVAAARNRLRRDLQLHRLPNGSPGARHGARRHDRDGAEGRRRI